MPSGGSMNRYWIPNIGIHRKVLTHDLQYYLGPQATVRPFTRNVRPVKHKMIDYFFSIQS